MHPAVQPPPQNRSAISPTFIQCPSPSTLQQQQQPQQQLPQQHILYGPITTLQPCTANLHPHCIYAGIPRNPGLSGPPPSLPSQAPIQQIAKGPKWQPKGKPSHDHQHHHPHRHYHNQLQQQFCQPLQHPQQHIQQPLTYIPKPLVLFDQSQANPSPPGIPPSANSFLIGSSTFAHNPYGHSEPYTPTSGLTLISQQPYLKLPEVPQTFCLLPERPQATQHHQQSVSGQNQGSFYNITATNTCNPQTTNPKTGFQLANATNPYSNVPAFGTSQINACQTGSLGKLWKNAPGTPNFGVAIADKLSVVPSIDVQTTNCSTSSNVPDGTKNERSVVSGSENIEWLIQAAREAVNTIFEVPDNKTSPIQSIQGNRLNPACALKNPEERYSDESAASFDFTIEAEKMVSALCNTTSSNDLGKDENHEQNETSAPPGSAVGDDMTNKTNVWFADFCTDYGVSVERNHRSVNTQTQDDKKYIQENPESIRKVIYWGCNEAESILSSTSYSESSKAEWLSSICRATRTAVTKSSTCFPIFAGDRIFVQDLMNAHLRISNGWLVLDNYFNKQHYPSLNEKYDRELMERFQDWQVCTNDLLRELVKNFIKIDGNRESNKSVNFEPVERQESHLNNSFPGDVALYTNQDIFCNSQRREEHSSKFCNSGKNERDITYTIECTPRSTSQQNFRLFEGHSQSHKETKLRSKWTIAESSSSPIDCTKSVPDISLGHSEPGFPGSSRFRFKNSSNSSSAKISSTRHSLNAEFFHLKNQVIESMKNSKKVERQHWGHNEQQYDLVFGASRDSTSITNGANNVESIFKIRTAGSLYENSYSNSCVPRLDSTNLINRSITSHGTNVDGSLYIASRPEISLDSSCVGITGTVDRNKTYSEPDYTGVSRVAQSNDHNCGSGLIVSTTNISSITPDLVYVGKSWPDQRELDAVPKTRMTLLSQIEGNVSSTNRDSKEMTANLSAWFASMRNVAGNRTTTCPVGGKKKESTLMTRTSTHPQETSRSAMDLNRQLQLDGNRQLQTLQNMQIIQSQPWNAYNLLNKKRNNCNIRGLDEYDSSEDVRVYMKPGSYNVPKKRHNRKSNRRGENPASSRGNNRNSGSAACTRSISGTCNASSSEKNHQTATSVSSFVIASTVQVSTTTTSTSTTIRVPFPATPIVPPPSTNFSRDNLPRLMRRVATYSNQETRQDVAWKAACASAEILLEALNVKEHRDPPNIDSKIFLSTKSATLDPAISIGDTIIENQLSREKEPEDTQMDKNFCAASSYEASEDDSSSTCKISPNSDLPTKYRRQVKQPKTNVKTDSWLISTLNNASIVSNIDVDDESDAESTVGDSWNSSIREISREHPVVVTSTPEPMIITMNEKSNGSSILRKNLASSPRNNSISASPRDNECRERSTSSTRQTLSVSLLDTSCEFVGRATYSETVRRFTGKSYSIGKKESCRSSQTNFVGSGEAAMTTSLLPATTKQFQRKDTDSNPELLQKSRKMVGKRLTRDIREKESEERLSNIKTTEENASAENSTKISAAKPRVKRKGDGNAFTGCTDTKIKASDRGWSVWHSSRRKQALNSSIMNKLANIHQTIWQMDISQVLRFPTSDSNPTAPAIGTIEDYCKVIKKPIFLETVGYKLKNRMYHKVENVLRDFRKIVSNSKVYHKNDTERIANIETLSTKLEDLFNDNFSKWDLENVLDSPGEDNSLPDDLTTKFRSSQKQQVQNQQQKSVANRFSTGTKINPVAPIKNDNLN